MRVRLGMPRKRFWGRLGGTFGGFNVLRVPQFTACLHCLLRQPEQRPRSAEHGASSRQRRRCRPTLNGTRSELLEARTLLATYLVTSPADSGPNTLRAAVQAASQSGDVVMIQSGLAIHDDSPIDVETSDLTIEGGGTTPYQVSVANVAGGPAFEFSAENGGGDVLEDLKLEDSGSSAAVYAEGPLIVSNAVLQGGGIYFTEPSSMSGGNSSITNTLFVNVPGIAVDAALFGNWTVSLQRDTWTGDTGALVYANSQGGTGSVIVNQSTMTGNTNTTNTAEVYSNGSLDLANSEITNNTCPGGILYAQEGLSQILSIATDGINNNNCGNGTTSLGGAIEAKLSQGQVYVDDTTVALNTTQNYAATVEFAGSGLAGVVNSAIADNTGNGLELTQSTKAILYNCVFSQDDPSASTPGSGVIVVNGGSVALSDSMGTSEYDVVENPQGVYGLPYSTVERNTLIVGVNMGVTGDPLVVDGQSYLLTFTGEYGPGTIAYDITAAD